MNQTKTPTQRAAFLIYLPALIIALAVLWDWVVRLWNWTPQPLLQHVDLVHYMYFGQRLVEGQLLWTAEYNDRLPVDQFLFWLPAKLNSFMVWHLMSIGACLLGAWAAYTLTRDIFSPDRGLPRGFPQNLGRYAGLYSGVLTLYLFAVLAEHNNGGLNQINVLPVSLALTAVVLTKSCLKRPRARLNMALSFALACLCASVAVGIRPHLVIFVALIPAWAAIAARLDGKSGGGGAMANRKAAAKFFLLWNLNLTLLFLCVNALPYIIAGEQSAFAAGMAMLARDVSWNDNFPQIAYRAAQAFEGQDTLSNALFLAGGAFAVILLGAIALLRLRVLTVDPRHSEFFTKVVIFELCVLTLIAPLSIEAIILTKRFWSHYAQLFAPFAAIGAVSLFVLIHRAKPRWLGFLLNHKAVPVILAVVLVSGPVSHLKTKFRQHKADLTPQNLSALLDELGPQGGFLAPYNIYVHWKLNHHRHGFPHATHTVRITGATPWGTEEWRGMRIPAGLHLPTSLREYCQMLDSRGPRLIVFFLQPHRQWARFNPLARCALREYDFYDVRAAARTSYDVASYFVRKNPAPSLD